MSRQAQYVPSRQLREQLDKALLDIKEGERRLRVKRHEAELLQRRLGRSVELERAGDPITENVPKHERVPLTLGDVFKMARDEFEAAKKR